METFEMEIMKWLAVKRKETEEYNFGFCVLKV